MLLPFLDVLAHCKKKNTKASNHWSNFINAFRKLTMIWIILRENVTIVVSSGTLLL